MDRQNRLVVVSIDSLFSGLKMRLGDRRTRIRRRGSARGPRSWNELADLAEAGGALGGVVGVGAVRRVAAEAELESGVTAVVQRHARVDAAFDGVILVVSMVQHDR